MWDPHGRHLGAAASAGKGAGKAYALAGDGAELVGRFRDQFSPWDFAGPLGGPRTLLRLPLRTPDQAAVSDICKVGPLLRLAAHALTTSSDTYAQAQSMSIYGSTALRCFDSKTH
jgi:hypothetical protein